MIKHLRHIFFAVLLALIYASCNNNHKASAGNTASYKDQGFFEKFFSPSPPARNMTLAPNDYTAYCENQTNGLIQTKEVGNFLFSAFYKPLNYLAIKEFKTTDSINKKLFDASVKEYGDLTYFSFKIQNTSEQGELLKMNISSDNEYYGRLEYMAFKMQQDFKLIQEKDTLNCSLYHFERVYGLAPHATFVLAFPKTNTQKEMKLWYHDKFFNTGIIMLNFEPEIISNLPTLAI